MNEEEINEMIIKCPACGIEGVAKSIMKELEIPHFGKVLETTIQCPHCGFRHSDVIALEQNDPAKYVIEINKNTLSVRVVRSQSATVSIPEAGVKVEPGPKSEGYVTNVEGVLTRFESAVKKALMLFEDDESQKNGKKGLVNHVGQKVVENKYDEIKSLGKDTNAYIVKLGDKYGIDGILDCKYQDIKPLNNKDIFVVKQDNKLKVVNCQAVYNFFL